MMILAVGSDNEEGYVRGLADVIRVVRVDFVTPEVHVLTIPRDLWVEIPNLGPHSENLRDFLGVGLDPDTGEQVEGDYGKINTAYFYGNLYDLPGGGPGTLALTINQNLGIPVDRYLAVNMQILADLVDEVGGITVEVPYDVSGFTAGTYQMDGETALAYSRVRRDDSDFFRSTRQTIVLLALREEYTKPENYRRIPQLTNKFLDETLTDLSRKDITALSCLATRVERDQITSHAINGSHVTFGTTTRRSSILWPNEEAIQQVIDEFMGNTE
jgi:LCP family protein required for cell wall assembly